MQLPPRRKTAAARPSLFHAQPCPKMSPESVAHERTIPPDHPPNQDEAFVSPHQAHSGLYYLNVNVNILPGVWLRVARFRRMSLAAMFCERVQKRYIASQ